MLSKDVPIIITDGLPIDKELLPLIQALTNGGILSESSCSGHGKELGHIWLKDGRILIIMPADTTKEQLDELIDKGYLVHYKMSG